MAETLQTTIKATQFWQELQSPGLQQIRLVMPVGALIRSVPIVSIQGHHPVVELNTAWGEVLTFTVTDTAEIKRIEHHQEGRNGTRYEVTFPLGDYFALITDNEM